MSDIHITILNLADLFFEQQKRYAAIFYQLQARLPQDPRFREEFSRLFRARPIKGLAHKSPTHFREAVIPQAARITLPIQPGSFI